MRETPASKTKKALNEGMKGNKKKLKEEGDTWLTSCAAKAFDSGNEQWLLISFLFLKSSLP